MKRFLLLAVFVIFAGTTMAQKFAYIDSEYILDNIPAYESAEATLEKLSKQYQTSVENMYAEVEKMYKSYQAEVGKLSNDAKRTREDAIIAREQACKEQQQKYFGPEGELSKRRDALMKPIRDQIDNAIRQIAAAGGYAIIFDKASGDNVVFANPQFDLSNQVLKQLGL